MELLIMLLPMLAIFYFILIRPENKRKREAEQLQNSLSNGDQITTIGGIIGKIVSIKDETVTIETGRDGSKIRILRSAVRCVDVPAEDSQK